MSTIYVSDTKNSKLLGSGRVDATYASISATCPNSCTLKGAGCYAQSSFVGMTVWKLDKASVGKSALAVAKEEAKLIDESYKGGAVPSKRVMRLHVSGDSRTRSGSKVINAAVKRWKSRGGVAVWSYTHAWRNVPRSDWKDVSMLASVDNVGEVAAATAQGYACAIVVGEHASEKAYKLDGSEIDWIPCPAQTRGVGCTDCKLCFQAERLFSEGKGIAFAAHGVSKNVIKRRLNVLRNDE